MEKFQQSNIAIRPHNLKLYPKERSTTHKKYRRATKILNTPRKTAKNPPKKALETNINTQSQRNLPIKPKTTKQSKHNKEKTEIENVPSVNWKNRVENRNTVTNMTRVLLAENLRASLEKQRYAEDRRESTTRKKNAKGKMQEEDTIYYL